MSASRLLAPVSLLVLCLAVASASETVHRAWLMPGECTAVPIEVSGNQLFQLLSEQQSQKKLRMTSLVTQGMCLRRTPDGGCAQAADDSFEACLVVTAGTADAAQLEGEIATDSRSTAFVYVSNPGEHPVLLDLLVVLEPLQQTVGDAIQTAVGSYRRSLLDSVHSGTVAVRSVAAAASEAVVVRSRSAHRRMLGTTDVLADNGNSSPTPTPSSTPTPSPSSSRSNSDIIGRIQDQVPDSAKKWVKIAVIIAIVLICLAVISILICLIKCICWPCCCAARAFK